MKNLETDTITKPGYSPLLAVILLFFGSTFLLAFLTGCGEQSVVASIPPPEVTVSPPLQKEVIEWDEYIGRLESVESVEVRSRVGGYLESIHFQDGDIVKEGDLLFVVDPRPYQAEVNRAMATVDLAAAELQLAANDLKRGLRIQSLESRAIAKEELDRRRSRRSGAQANVKAAEAALEAARLNLEFTHIRAPITGRISRNYVTEGNLIDGGTAQSTLLTTIVSLDPIYCYFDADERSYLRYVRLSRSGARPSGREVQHPVYLALADQTGFPHRGYLDFVDNRLDSNTGTMTGRAIFPNPDYSLIPGLFARIRLVGSGAYEALMLPEKAVGNDLSQRYVFVVDEQNVVEYRSVELGPLIGGLRVIRSGLEPADQVIVNGIQKARNGSKVTPLPGEIQYEPENFDSRPVS